jgi:hypothetical protein
MPVTLGAINDKVLRLAEVQGQAVKRTIETGKTCGRRFVTEKDVSADVIRHEDHAEIMRRQHNRGGRKRRAGFGEQDRPSG